VVVVIAERHEHAAGRGDAGVAHLRGAAAIGARRPQQHVARVGHGLHRLRVARDLVAGVAVVDDDQVEVGVILRRDARDRACRSARLRVGMTTETRTRGERGGRRTRGADDSSEPTAAGVAPAPWRDGVGAGRDSRAR